MSTTTFTELLSEREIILPEPAARLAAPSMPLPALPFDHAAPVSHKARARRRARIDWEAMAVVLLMLVCAVACIYRLLWSVQF